MEIEITMTIVNKGCGDNPEKNTKQLRENVSKIKKVFCFVMNQGQR